MIAKLILLFLVALVPWFVHSTGWPARQNEIENEPQETQSVTYKKKVKKENVC